MDVWNIRLFFFSFWANGRSPSVVWQGENEPVLLLSHLWQNNAEPERKGEEDEEEILALLLLFLSFFFFFFSSPVLPGSSRRQMTGVCGRLITPGWVFLIYLLPAYWRNKQEEPRKSNHTPHMLPFSQIKTWILLKFTQIYIVTHHWYSETRWWQYYAVRTFFILCIKLQDLLTASKFCLKFLVLCPYCPNFLISNLAF